MLFLMGACPAVSGEPYPVFRVLLAPLVLWLQAGAGIGWLCTGRWAHTAGPVLREWDTTPL